MGNSLQILGQWEIFNKSFVIYGEFDCPLFLAKQVADHIEHKDVTSMLRTVGSNEKVLRSLSGECGNPNKWFLTEDGLYEVLMQSRKPIAKQFKQKVKEILREIRKTGSYSVQPVQASQLNIMTYRQEVVILFKDLIRLIGRKENTIYSALRKSSKCKDGTDYEVLKGKNLREFKQENGLKPSILWRSIIVVFESGYKKLCQYFKIADCSKFPALASAVPIPVQDNVYFEKLVVQQAKELAELKTKVDRQEKRLNEISRLPEPVKLSDPMRKAKNLDYLLAQVFETWPPEIRICAIQGFEELSKVIPEKFKKPFWRALTTDIDKIPEYI